LYVIVKRQYAHYDEPKQAIILALAYAQYSVIKKDNIKGIYEPAVAAPLKDADIRRRDSEIKGAWKHISNENQLTQYCEASDRLLTTLLKATQGEARQVIDQAIISEIEKIVEAVGIIQEDTGKLSNVETMVRNAQNDKAKGKLARSVWDDEARPIRLFVTKPLQTLVASVVILPVAILVALGIQTFWSDGATWIVEKLKALEKLIAPPR
jgi:hypothetical protein